MVSIRRRADVVRHLDAPEGLSAFSDCSLDGYRFESPGPRHGRGCDAIPYPFMSGAWGDAGGRLLFIPPV